MRMSCSRHEGDWGPPEYGRIPVVCFGLLFGRHHAVWCDVGHGLTARDGRGLALHVIQLPAVVIRPRTTDRPSWSPRKAPWPSTSLRTPASSPYRRSCPDCRTRATARARAPAWTRDGTRPSRISGTVRPA